MDNYKFVANTNIGLQVSQEEIFGVLAGSFWGGKWIAMEDCCVVCRVSVE